MNSMNNNSLKSIFENYDKNQSHELNLNEYHQQSQNSQSFGFTFFNHSHRIFNNQKLEINQIKNVTDENIDLKQHTIGFNSINNTFFQNSLKLTTQQFKNIIKKPTTFHLKQCELNILHQHSIKHQHQDQQSNEQINFSSSIDDQNQDNIIKEGEQNKKIKIKRENPYVKLEQDEIQQEQKTQKSSKKNSKIQNNQGNVQNLKSLARIVYNTIKCQKITTYKTVSDRLLQSMNNSQYDQKTLKIQNDQSNNSPQNKNKQNIIIQKMIKNKSFSQINQMKEIQKNGQENKKNELTTNIKNVRRRLYDAINVMLAANIIQKKSKDYLALKFKPKLKQQQQNDQQTKKQPLDKLGFEELQNLIRNKQSQIDIKLKYRQMLITKYLTLGKHIAHNFNLRNQRNKSKMSFPLIFAKLPTPSTLNIENQGERVEIQAEERIDILCDLDILSYIYWVQKQEIKRKQDELQKSINNLNQQNQMINENGHKRVKQNQKLKFQVNIT